tara:strand:- start:43 stop:387 length:345 start_codon:yes stop_codon:yes gene_type:complete
MKGIHFIIDFDKLPFKFLNNMDKLEKILERVIKISKTKIISFKKHKFKPQGLTGIYLLSESHLSFHTWPELGSISIDLYTCGDLEAGDKSIEYLIKKLSSISNEASYKLKKIAR